MDARVKPGHDGVCCGADARAAPATSRSGGWWSFWPRSGRTWRSRSSRQGSRQGRGGGV